MDSPKMTKRLPMKEDVDVISFYFFVEFTWIFSEKEKRLKRPRGDFNNVDNWMEKHFRNIFKNDKKIQPTYIEFRTMDCCFEQDRLGYHLKFVLSIKNTDPDIGHILGVSDHELTQCVLRDIIRPNYMISRKDRELESLITKSPLDDSIGYASKKLKYSVK